MNEYDDILNSEKAAGGPNEYDAAIARDGERQKLRASLYGAIGVNPDEAARAKRAGTALGVPPAVAQRNLPDVERAAKLNEYDALLDTAPKLARQLQDPNFASVAHDDTPALGALESAFRPIVGPRPTAGSVLSGLAESFTQGAERAKQGIRLSFADLFGFESMREDALRRIRQSQFAQDVSTPAFESQTTQGLYGGGASLLQQIPGIAAALVTRNPTPAIVAAGGQVSLDAYGKYRGRGATPAEAALGAYGEGATEVLTEMMPMGFLVKQFGKAGAGHFLTGLLAREIPSEQVATLVQDAIDTATANPGKTWGDYLAERPGAAYQTLLAVLVQSGALGAVHVGAAHMQARAERAAQDAQTLGSLNQAATDSKLRARDPEAFRQYVAKLAEDGPVTDVYVDGATFQQEIAKAGIDPAQLAQVLPEAGADIAGGGDVRIPVEDFAAHIAGTPLGDALLPHLRTDSDAMSQAEAQTFMQEQATKFQAEAEKIANEREFDTAFKQSAQTVENELLAQLTQANRFTGDVNSAYAKMMSSFYAVQAARLGITPEEMYVRYPLRIAAEGVAGARTMDQPPADLTPEQRVLYDAIPREVPGKLTAEQIAIESRFAADMAREGFDATLARYAAEGESQGGRVLNTDIARELSPDYRADRARSAAVHEPASDLIKRLYAYKLAQPTPEGKRPTVLFTAGGTGAGKSTGLKLPELQHVAPTAEMVYDTNMNGFESAARKIDQALAAGREAYIVYTFRDPVDALVHGALPRAERMAQEKGSGRTVPLREHARTHLGAFDAIPKLMAHYANDPRVAFRVVDNSHGAGKARVVSLDEIAFQPDNSIEEKLNAALEAEYRAGRISARTYEGFAGRPPEDAAATVRGPDGAGDRGQPQPAGQSAFRQSALAREEDNTHRARPGDPILVYRVGSESDLGNRNAGNAQGVADFLARADDPFSSVKGAKGAFLYAYEVRAPEQFGKYEPLNGQPAEQSTIGRKDNRGAVWYSFPAKTEQRVVAKIPMSEVRTALERAGYDTFDDSGSIEGARVIRELLHDQTFGQDARGQITFADRGATIALLQRADLSTFLHESGHFYLEVLADMASQPDAPAEVKADLDKLLAWFGVKELAAWQALSTDEKRPYHEQLARGFEAYLFEGKTPNAELQGLFARFRAWLLNVYRSLKALNVELTDEVRGVFDRMLATNEQILAAQQARDMVPIFETPEQAGMTPEEFAAYQALGQDATQAAVDQLQKRSLRDMRWLNNARSRELGRLQREASAKRKAVHAEVTAEVEAEPVNQVREFTKQAGNKLAIGALEQMYDGAKDAPNWRNLPRSVVAQDGLHPDLVADMFGLSSGDELVRKLLSEPSATEKIEALTDQRMLERYGDITSPDALARAVDEAVHNDARGRFVASELDALERANDVKADTGRKARPDSKGRRRRITVDALARGAKQFAAEIVARKRIRDIKPAQFSAAATRAAKAAEKALKGNDVAEAAAQKRNQLLGHYSARAANAALTEVEKAVAYLRKFDSEATRKGLDSGYVDQIDKLLERFDLRQVSNREADRRKSLLEWAESQREQGLDPVIGEALLNEAQRVPYREMPLEEFRGLVDAVKNIEHLGRLKKRLLTAQDNREFAEHVAEAVQSIEANAKKTLPTRLESNTWADAIRKGFNDFFAWHRKLASLFREMDGVKDNGTLWNLFVRPMNAAGDREATMREHATVALSKLLTKDIAHGMNKKTFIPAIDASLTRQARLSIALNWGNEANRQRVLDGEGWSPAQAQAVLDTLSKSEWDFVQGVWDYLDSFWPQIAAKEKRVTGVAPERVVPAPVQTPHGEYRGGYYPIKYDPERSSRAESDTLAESLKQTLQGAYTRATTRRGHTKARVDQVVGRPVRKDLGVIFEHVAQVAHDLAWHEYLIDANRLLRAKPIDAAIRAHYGPEVLRAIRQGFEDIAIGDVPAITITDKIINHIRVGTTVTGLGWNLTTALLQPLGLTQSMVRIGPRWVLQGIGRWMGDAARMENSVAWIGERSEFMRLRAKTMQREISEIRNKVSGRDSFFEASFFALIQKMQLVADVPTWLGMYEKQMAAGVDEKTAIALADQAVLDAQGGGQIKDLAGVQRGGPLQKLWTNFYSFFSTTFNLTAESTARTDFKNPVSAAMWATDMLLLYTIPAILGAMLKAVMKGDADDPEKLAKRLLSESIGYRLGTMVLVRELTAAVDALLGLHADYSGPPSVRVFAEAAKLGQQIQQGEFDEALFKALNNTAGILFHYPAGQVQRTILGALALINGDEEATPLSPVVGPPSK